jgi:hypothetical protein
MSTNNIFGHPFDTLPDHDIEVIVDNPQVRSWFAQNTRSLHILQRYKHDHSLRGKVIKLLKVATGVASVGAAIKASLSNNPREETTGSNLRKRKSSLITPDTQGTKRKFTEISPDIEGMVRRQPIDVDRTLNFGDGDVEMDSQSGSGSTDNSKALATRESSATSATGRAAQHGETEVSNIPYSLKTPWQKTVQARCVYYKTFDLTLSSGANSVQHCSFRLNSIYDCQRDATYSEAEITAGTADSSTGDATVQKPTYRDYWMNYYKYWTVVKSAYRFRFYVRPTSADYSANLDNRDIEVIGYVYHHGQQQPPKFNTGSTTVAIPHYIKRDHDGMYYFPLRYDTLSKGTSFGDLPESCSGDYEPGSIVHEVGEDEEKQTWHKPTEVPPQLEAVTVHFQKSPWSQYGGDILVRCEVTLEYHAQFKDLYTIFQYPTGETDNPAQTNPATQSN